MSESELDTIEARVKVGRPIHWRQVMRLLLELRRMRALLSGTAGLPAARVAGGTHGDG